MSTKNVIKVEIRSTSGFCSYEDAYEDKIVITKESIKYTYNPMFISDINPVKNGLLKQTMKYSMFCLIVFLKM